MSYRTSDHPITTRTLLDALLTALTSRPAAALLTTPTIQLITAATTPPSIDSVVGDFTEADFSGYAAQAITLSANVNLDTSTQGRLANADFIATTATPFLQNTVIGYMLTDGASALYLVEMFDEPVFIANVGDFLSLDFFTGIVGILELT